jgi:hypothetical protein
MLFYILSMVVLAIPGVAAAIFLSHSAFIVISSTFTAFLALTVVNLPVALLTLYLCRDLLVYTELNH